MASIPTPKEALRGRDALSDSFPSEQPDDLVDTRTGKGPGERKPQRMDELAESQPLAIGGLTERRLDLGRCPLLQLGECPESQIQALDDDARLLPVFLD